MIAFQALNPAEGLFWAPLRGPALTEWHPGDDAYPYLLHHDVEQWMRQNVPQDLWYTVDNDQGVDIYVQGYWNVVAFQMRWG